MALVQWSCALLLVSVATASCDPFERPDAVRAPNLTFEVPTDVGAQWFKGNTHSHTTESDGDSSPSAVAAWYKDHGYDFLVLSDHNVFTHPSTLAALQDDGFILIPGEELTSSFESKPLHVNGLNIPGVIEPRRDSTLVATLQANVDAVRDVDGVPHINHPNYQWAIGHRELLQVRGDRLLEIYNGHHLVHNEGGGASLGMEAVWDFLLAGGKRIYGIAVDDAHHFRGEFAPDRDNPGRGWVTVRANALDPAEIMRRLEEGQFYASTGVVVTEFLVEPTRLTVTLEERQSFKYTTYFFGAGGRLLAQTGENPAVYDLEGEDKYVRVRIQDSGGARAWLQPVFVEVGRPGASAGRSGDSAQ